MGDPYHRDALLAVEAADGIKHLAAAAGIEHGGGFIQNQRFGLHGQDARNGDALLLAARQGVGCAIDEGKHLHLAQRGLNARGHLGGGHADVFQAEGHIVAHDGGYQLVIGILKHHACAAADIPGVLIILGIHAAHGDMALGGNIQAVEQLCQRGFAAAVVPKHGRHFARAEAQGHAANGHTLAVLIGVANVVCTQNEFFHGSSRQHRNTAYYSTKTRGAQPAELEKKRRCKCKKSRRR